MSISIAMIDAKKYFTIVIVVSSIVTCFPKTSYGSLNSHERIESTVALEELKRAAASGKVEAQNALGKRYREGIGVILLPFFRQ